MQQNHAPNEFDEIYGIESIRMNLQNHGQPDQIGMVSDHTIPYQLNQVMVPGYTSQPAASAPVPVSYEEILHQQRLQLQQKLQNFWANQNNEMQKTTDFKKRLPLSRLKKAMKVDRDVKMISSETPTVIAKACEMFIQELTLRSWCHAEANRRRRLQKSDILSAINRTETFDFLADIANRDGRAQVPTETMSTPVIDFDPSVSSLLYDIMPPPKVGTVIEPMPVMEPYSGLPYNVATPRQVGNSGIVISNSLTGFGLSSLPYEYAPQVCEAGMDHQPIHVQTSLAGTMGPCSLDPFDIQHQFQLQVGEMVTGKSAAVGQPTCSEEDPRQDLEELMRRMEELDELESTYIERVTLWR